PPPAPLAGRDAVRSGGRVIALTPRESAVYRLLYEAGGAAVSREEIHRRVWGGEGDPSVVNVYIHYLRRKLSDGARQPIRHVRGGYALCLGTHAPPDEAGE
ncbi:MAG: winged helix-turn-helix domain-containing protein, partial [Clostridia bacterium]|nr:winged helix-turn-helix domain-containing protein [Clostridia bacterium]